MDVLLSNEVTIVSTNAPERRPGEVEWTNAAWPAGSIVTRSDTQRVYRAAYDVPSGGVPPEENRGCPVAVLGRYGPDESGGHV